MRIGLVTFFTLLSAACGRSELFEYPEVRQTPDMGASSPDAGRPHVSTGCDALPRFVLGNAEVISTDHLGYNKICGAGVSDGEGGIALPVYQIATISSTTLFLSPAPGTLTQVDADSMIPFGQPSGFMGIDMPTNWIQFKLRAVDHSGALVLDELVSSNPSARSVDPLGGIVVAEGQYGGPPTIVEKYSAQGQPRWSAAVDVDLQLLATDLNGSTLALSVPGEGPVGYWFGPAGEIGPTLAGPTLNLVSDWALRVGGGFFLAIPGDGGVEWTASVSHRDTAVHPAPAWLASRPNTRVFPIFGGAAYAIVPRAGTAPVPCEQTVTIVDADGNVCGQMSLGSPMSTCIPGEVMVGIDGSIIQTGPRDLDDCTSGGSCTCTWRVWRGALE